MRRQPRVLALPGALLVAVALTFGASGCACDDESTVEATPTPTAPPTVELLDRTADTGDKALHFTASTGAKLSGAGGRFAIELRVVDLQRALAGDLRRAQPRRRSRLRGRAVRMDLPPRRRDDVRVQGVPRQSRQSQAGRGVAARADHLVPTAATAGHPDPRQRQEHAAHGAERPATSTSTFPRARSRSRRGGRPTYATRATTSWLRPPRRKSASMQPAGRERRASSPRRCRSSSTRRCRGRSGS